jgi:hypothetical protein
MKPILFSTAMVQAILNGTKTQTRRALKVQPPSADLPYELVYDGMDKETGKHFLEVLYKLAPTEIYRDLGKCPFGRVGDILWVRESHKLYLNFDNQVMVSFEGQEHFHTYNRKHITLHTLEKIKARELKVNEWHSCPSIHLYREFARIFLKIKAIRVERLHDISDADILKEGVRIPVSDKSTANHTVVFELGVKDSAISFLPEGRCAKGKPKLTQNELLSVFWAELWCKVNGRKSYDLNPFVWVIEFERTEKPTE